MMFRLAAAALLALSLPAAAQTRSPTSLKEPQAFLQSCSGYSGDGEELCRMGQKEFSENYADAMAGRLSSWVNLSYFFYGSSDNIETFGIRPDRQSACKWALAVVFSASSDLNIGSISTADRRCTGFSVSQFEADVKAARDIVQRIKLIDEDSPKAPWAEPAQKINPACLDSSVAPLNGPAPPPFVPPPGCLKKP
jgi:hypothetical protein